MRPFFAFLFFLSLSLAAVASGIRYTVDFEGLHDTAALKSIKSTAQLTSLKKRPPASVNALRYRAESDIPEILKVLHAHGYYEATVNIQFREEENKTRVIVNIQPGPVYKIGTFILHLYSEKRENRIVCPQITLENIGIHIGKIAIASEIVQAELRLLQILSECGYPLAEIANREMIADGLTKTLSIELEVQAGPLAYFGKTTVEGLIFAKERLIQQKTQWKEGDLYNSSLVEATQKALLDTGLFSSVLINHDTTLSANNALNMNITVAESRHRSINIGVSYQTYYGPGVTFGWENRNVDGMGRSLSLQGEATKRSQDGIARYFVSDFYRLGQDYLWQAQVMHEDIKAYSERSYNLINRLERKFGKKFRMSVSAELEKLYVTSSVDNGIFLLFELPIYLRWSTANSLLNPTQGMTIDYSMKPSVNLEKVSRNYLMQKFSYSYYLPMTKDHSIVLAQKVTLGIISSGPLSSVPIPKRFLGGTSEDLRGYQYKTVSPLAHHEKPIGGRSAIFYTFEMRFRFTETIGFVPFFDLGTVWLEQVPQTHGKWFKAAGFGVRYFSFMGPFRFDIGFPLDRRKGIDPVYQIFASIGQMF
jgi:translocation and assembly module TamA